MGRLGQGAKALAASMRQKEVAEDKLKQQAKKDAKDRAKAARRRTKDLVDEGAGLYYDKIQEVDPDVVNGRVSPVERPQMKPLFSGTDDDEPGEDKDEQGEDRGQSTQCSNLLPSAYSAAEELDPNPPRGGNGSRRRPSPPREEQLDPPNWKHPAASQRGSLAPEKRLPLETIVESHLNKSRVLGRDTSNSGFPTEQTNRIKLKKVGELKAGSTLSKPAGLEEARGGHGRVDGSDGSDRDDRMALCAVPEKSLVPVGVDPRLVRPKRSRDDKTGVPRALAAAILYSNALGHGFYKDDDELLYMRAVHEGMTPFNADGEANDPREFFSKEEATYLVSVHSKALSSKRSELAGTRGVRNVFDTVAEYNLKKVTDEDKEAAEKWASEMRDGKWHEDADGVPFSSKMLCSVVKSVWKEPSLAITAYQLVWTCLVVEAHLRGQNLDMNDTINANNMEAMAKVVAARFTAARKAKQVTKVTVKDIDKSVTVMELIPTYIELGSDGLRGGRKEKKQKTKGKARVTEQAAWDTILGGEEQPEEVADE